MTETHELRPVDGARGPLVLEEGQEGYDEARRIHNGLIDKRPALIYECQRESDVSLPSRRLAPPALRSRCAAAATTWQAGLSARAG